MSKIIYFEQHRPVLLTRVTDADLFLDAYVDSDGQKYIAMPSAHGLSFIPLFEDDAQSWNMIRNMGASSADVPYRRRKRLV